MKETHRLARQMMTSIQPTDHRYTWCRSPLADALRRAVIGLAAAACLAGNLSAAERPHKAGAANLPGKRTDLKNVTVVAFDTETTGFNATTDRIVEVGVVKFKNGEVLESKTWLIDPERKIPYRARRVHGIDDDMVAGQPTFDAVYPEFTQFIEGSVLIAHNARFDIAFIVEETQRKNLHKPPNVVIDSLALFRNWFPQSESFSLEGLAEHLALGKDTFHRALADSMLVIRILEIGLEKNEPPKTLGGLQKAAGGALTF